MTTVPRQAKRATGLPGLDAATHGGLPSAGGTLLIGPPGSGKTNLSLQIASLVARTNQATVFVTFEEAADQIVANAASFGWGKDLATRPNLHILDARPPVDSDASGAFDLEALFGLLPALTEPDPPSWLVLDGIDQLLVYEHDTRTAIQQIRALQDWSQQHGVTTIVTAKPPDANLIGSEYVEAAKYALPTIIQLTAELDRGHLARRLRILKYRGTAHATNDISVILNSAGFQLPYQVDVPDLQPPASRERVSSGIPRLDEILGGGVYAGSTTLISGAPGTAKTNLALHFVTAAAERGEPALVVSYDEPSGVIIRDASSIGLDLQPYVDDGTITLHAVPAWTAVVEEHVLALQNLIHDTRPKILVIDPVSALYKTTDADNAYLSIEQILTTTRANGITTILTSLLPQGATGTDETLSHASTLADTWIALDYRVTGGERNRALSIVKSRGTRHSNQVRELLLSDRGMDLADVYQLGTQVLMGTARLQAESERATQDRQAVRAGRQRQRSLEGELAETEARLRDLARERERLQEELRAEADDAAETDRQANRQANLILANRRGHERRREPDGLRPDDDVPAAGNDR